MTLEEIKSLVELMDESTLSRLSIKQDGFSLSIERGGVTAPVAVQSIQAAPAAAPVAAVAAASENAPAAAKEGEFITSPMVGTFYKSPSPDSPAFIKPGDRVTKGKTICILEAMKIFNEVEAEFDCTILEILVNDGQVVEYDTPLFRIKRG
ncbi:MAG: acetyl-CoA carboxylase biotin carboxyl carrier protein [Campylobacterales bacterium]